MACGRAAIRPPACIAVCLPRSGARRRADWRKGSSVCCFSLRSGWLIRGFCRWPRRSKSAGSRSTRRIASAIGGTIFGPSIGSSRFCASDFQRPACTPSPPPRRRGSATTSSRSLACASLRCSSVASIGRISFIAFCRWSIGSIRRSRSFAATRAKRPSSTASAARTPSKWPPCLQTPESGRRITTPG